MHACMHEQKTKEREEDKKNKNVRPILSGCRPQSKSLLSTSISSKTSIRKDKWGNSRPHLLPLEQQTKEIIEREGPLEETVLRP